MYSMPSIIQSKGDKLKGYSLISTCVPELWIANKGDAHPRYLIDRESAQLIEIQSFSLSDNRLTFKLLDQVEEQAVKLKSLNDNELEKAPTYDDIE